MKHYRIGLPGSWLIGWMGVLFVLLVGMQAMAHSPQTTVLPEPQATMPTVRPFGVETNSGRINQAIIQQRAGELGISWLRLNTLSWRDLQPTEETPPEAWNWETLDTFTYELQSAFDLGLTPMIIADDFPDWAVIPYTNIFTGEEGNIAPCAALKEAYFDDYALFLREVLARYKEQMRGADGNIYLELGNEPDVDPSLIGLELQNLFGCWGNISDPYYGGEHYGEMLKAVVPLVREADPGVRIIIGGLLLDRPETNVVGRGKPEKFFEGMLRAGAGDYFDIVGYHAYPWYDFLVGLASDSDLYDGRWRDWGGMTIGKARFLRQVMADYDVERPLMLNEMALLFWGGDGDPDFFQNQADHIVRVVVRGMSVDVQAFSWYTLHASGWNSSGLMNRDNTPRPAYHSYQQLINQTSTSTMMPVEVPIYGDTVEAYQFGGGEALVDVLWKRPPPPGDNAALAAEVCNSISDHLDWSRCQAYFGSGSKIDFLNLVAKTASSGTTTEQIYEPLSQRLHEVSPPPLAGYAAAETAEVAVPKPFFIAAYTRDGVALAPTDETEMEVFLPIGISPTYIVQQPLDGPTPTVASCTPTESHNTAPTTLAITGTHFVAGVEGFLQHPTTHATYALEAVTHLGPNHLSAVVPSELPPGSYNVLIRFPRGWTSKLLQGYRVQANAPVIARVWPGQGRADQSNILFIAGEHFSERATIQVGDISIPPTLTMVIRETLIRATLPASFLAPGTYGLTVTNPDTTQHTLAQSITLVSPEDRDLSGNDGQLWTDPVSPRTGMMTRIGIVVQHWGRNPLNSDVPVTFSLENAEGEHVSVGEAILAAPILSDTSRTAVITWTVTMSKSHTLYAVIDAANTIEETNENNNTIARPLFLLPVASDQTAPVARLTINGETEGAETSDPGIILNVRATDQFSESIEASPPMEEAWLLFQEYEYSQGAAQWIAAQHSETWVRARGDSSLPWQLIPSEGKKYLLVWVADAAGNISQPASVAVTYRDTTSTDNNGDRNMDPPDQPGGEMTPPLPLPPELMQGGSAHVVYLPLVLR
jgi:hypothetical protein